MMTFLTGWRDAKNSRKPRASKSLFEGFVAQFTEVLSEALGIHQRNGSEAPHVAIGENVPRIEPKEHRSVMTVVVRQLTAAGCEERAGKARLHNKRIGVVERHDDMLGASSRFENRCSPDALCECPCGNFAQHIRSWNSHSLNRTTRDGRMHTARDRLYFRQLRHGGCRRAAPRSPGKVRAIQCRASSAFRQSCCA